MALLRFPGGFQWGADVRAYLETLGHTPKASWELFSELIAENGVENEAGG